jgi:hypothetical protein
VSLESKRECKLLKCACLSVINTDDLISDPILPTWSHREISYSQADRWAAILEPSHFPYINSVGSRGCSSTVAAPSTSCFAAVCLPLN